MRGYLFTTILFLIALNLGFILTLVEEDYDKEIRDLNLLIGLNTLITIPFFVFKKFIRDMMGLAFMGTIPFRIGLFLLFFFLRFEADHPELLFWTLTYLFAYFVYHMTETGFIVKTLK